MRTLKVDRFDATLAICADKEKKLFAIEKSELPKGVKVGDIISIDDEGTIDIISPKKGIRK